MKSSSIVSGAWSEKRVSRWMCSWRASAATPGVARWSSLRQEPHVSGGFYAAMAARIAYSVTNAPSLYCSSVTGSIHSTFLPSIISVIAR